MCRTIYPVLCMHANLNATYSTSLVDTIIDRGTYVRMCIHTRQYTSGNTVLGIQYLEGQDVRMNICGLVYRRVFSELMGTFVSHYA